jgi:hypothetical protein
MEPHHEKKDSSYKIPITEVQVECGDLDGDNKLQPLFLDQENSNIPLVLSIDRLKEAAGDAISYGYIDLGTLIYILTMDGQYPDEIIQHLWNKYHQGIRRQKDPSSRLSFWHMFMLALSLRKLRYPNRIFNGLQGVPILPLSFLDEHAGKVVEFNREINPSGDGALVCLEELEKYFPAILKIPVPNLLFPHKNIGSSSRKGTNIHQGIKDNSQEWEYWDIAEPDFLENPTDINFFKSSFLAGPEGPDCDPFENEVAYLDKYDSHSDEWLKHFFQNVKVLKHVKLYELAHFMASESKYEGMLQMLWEYCGFNDDPNKRFPEWNQNKITRAYSRARIWYFILSRWTTYNYFKRGVVKVSNYYFGQLKSSVKSLPLYKDENVFVKVPENESQSCEQYIKLSEFREYLLHLQDFNISVPLPSQLFPIDNEPALISSITANRLMKMWEIDEHELIQFLINGLKAYKPGGENLIDERLDDNIREMAIRRVLGKHPEKAVLGLLFNISNLEEFKNKHSDLPPIEIFPKQASYDSDIQVEKQKTGKNQLFPCPPGTRWEEINITLIANDTVRIRTPKGEERFTYHELGFSDKRKGDAPKKIWTWLVAFAKSKGDISPADNSFIENLPEYTKRLNKHLKTLFGISDSIFKGHYKKYRGYKTRIQFFDETQKPTEISTSKSVREEIADEFEEEQNKYLNY